MKQVSVADFKANFSDWLDAVRQGERIAIQYGRRKEIVAILTPPTPSSGGFLPMLTPAWNLRRWCARRAVNSTHLQSG